MADLVENFDLKDFQSKVYKNFESIKLNVSFAKLEDKGGYEYLKNHNRLKPISEKHSLLSKVVSSLFAKAGKYSKDKVVSQPEFIEKEKKATEIIFHPKTKSLLIPKFRHINFGKLSKSEYQLELIEIITTELSKDISIEKDVRLFGLMTLKIWQIGVENYCKNK
jgi:hypothetical protein